jgi:uncharacterized membrane protein YtjA (UPF0391 family)
VIGPSQNAKGSGMQSKAISTEFGITEARAREIIGSEAGRALLRHWHAPRIHGGRTLHARGCWRRIRGGQGADMIKWAIILAVIGLVAGALGFSGVAGAAMGIAKFLFWAAIIIAVVLLVLGLTVFKAVS